MRCNPLDLYPLHSVVEREKLAIFGVCVPQKQAEIVWEKVQQLWRNWPGRPFELLARLRRRGRLHATLVNLRIGQYQRVETALSRLSLFETSWTWEDIESSVGRKTARMVGLYSVPSARVAALDRIVLANLRILRPEADIPVSTPNSRRRYEEVQDYFLSIADAQNLYPWELDKKWWSAARFRRKA